MSDDLPATGVVGAEVPAGAPHEVSQPLQPGAGGIVFADGTNGSPLARARQNEQELQPLTYGKGPTSGGVAEAVEAAGKGQLDPFYSRRLEEAAAEGRAEGVAAISTSTIKRIRRPLANRPPVPGPAGEAAEGVPVRVSDTGTPVITAPVAGPPAADPAAAPPPAPIDHAHMPAMSDTDSPTRGQPRIAVRPGKEISGGFADQIAAQYFAINGQELRVLVESLMDGIYNRLQNDLRFNEALTYPQVCARVVVEISGFARDSDFIVDIITPPTADVRSKTPVAIARQFADEVAFVLIAERAETDPSTGESAETPDSLRIDLGLQRPNKRVIRTGGTETFADV